MASEPLITDQSSDEHVEMKKVVVIEDNGHESSSGIKELVGKDEDKKITLENSSNIEAVGIDSAGKAEVDEIDTVIEVAKVEASDKDFASDILATDGLGVLKDPERESDASPSLQPEVEDNGEELKNQSESDTHESPIEAEEKSVENLMPFTAQKPESEVPKEAAVSESVSEEIIIEELKETPSIPSSLSEIESKQEEPPIISTAREPASNFLETPIAGESVEISHDEKKLVEVEASLESKTEEAADLAKLEEETNKVQETVMSVSSEAVVLDAAKSNKLDEAGCGAAVPDVSDILEPEKAYTDPNANVVVEKSDGEGGFFENLVTDELCESLLPVPSTAVGLTENIAEPQFLVEEKKQEKTIEVEETPLSETAEIDAGGEVSEILSEGKNALSSVEMVEGKLDETSEGNMTTTFTTSEDFDDASEILEISPENEKPAEGVQISKEKIDNNLEDDNTSSVETSKYHDATVEVSEISSSEGAKVSEGVDIGEEEKDETPEGVESTLIKTSKDLDPPTEVTEVSSVLEKASEFERVEKCENLVVDKVSSLKNSKYHDTSTEFAELSSSGEVEISESVETVEEENKNIEDDKITSDKLSGDPDHPTEVTEVLSEVEQTSKPVERVEEGENLENGKTTLVETSKDLLAAAKVPEVVFEGEEASRNVEMVEETHVNSEGGRGIKLDETYKDPNATAEVSFEGEKASGGAAIVEEEEENLEGDKGPTLFETSENHDVAIAQISSQGEKTSESLKEKVEGYESEGKTSIETSKEKTDIATPAKEPPGGAEAESELKLSQPIEAITDKSWNIEDSEVKEETKNADDRNVEDGGDTTEKEDPKEVHVKPSERRSNNMISKVKKSIVKVRKAIFGKSPSSKTMASEGKDDLKG